MQEIYLCIYFMKKAFDGLKQEIKGTGCEMHIQNKFFDKKHDLVFTPCFQVYSPKKQHSL